MSALLKINKSKDSKNIQIKRFKKYELTFFGGRSPREQPKGVYQLDGRVSSQDSLSKEWSQIACSRPSATCHHIANRFIRIEWLCKGMDQPCHRSICLLATDVVQVAFRLEPKMMVSIMVVKPC